MQTILLNLVMAALWCVFADYALFLVPASIVVLMYSFATDYHDDAEDYRDALADR